MQKIVLFADDEQYYLTPIKFKMEALGHKVLTATNISEAIDLLKINAVDVLVLDIMMDPGEILRDKIEPGLAGYQALNIVKQISPKTQIVCMSVKEDPIILKELKRRGIVFIGKGQTSLRKAVSIINSKLTGLITDSDLTTKRGRKWEAR
jgi:CheY-like chemotaxis protein